MRPRPFAPIVLSTAVALALLATGPAPGKAAAGPADQGAPAAAPVADPGWISGVVTDAGGAPIPGAAVTLRAASDSALVTGVLTNGQGAFRLQDLPLDEYLLHVGHLGYRGRSSEVIELTGEVPGVDLGAIALETSPITLDPIEAMVDRPQMVVEADRTVYDTRAMPVATAGTAVDVLRAVPELEVDVNSNVRLRGNQTVAIHLNGRPTPLRGEQLATFLEQLPGDRIARVEVMPNPTARHDPEGMGGIVNIVLREDVELGLSGSLTVNASTRNRQSLSGRFNVQRGRLTLFSGAGGNIFRHEMTSHLLQRNLVTDPVTVLEQTRLGESRGRGGNLDWTAEFALREGTTLWSSAWMFLSDHSTEGSTEYEISGEGDDLREHYDRANDQSNDWHTYNLGLGWKEVFEPQEEELTVDLRIMRSGSDRETLDERLFHVLAGEPAELPLELTLNEVDQGTGNLSLQVDYFRPVAEGRLEVGYRALRRDQDDDNLLRVFESPGAIDPRDVTDAGYDYREMFHSLYGTWGRTHGRFGYQVGLRAETSSMRFHSLVEETGFERDLSTVYPSFNFSFNPEPGRSLRLLYSRRVSRPSPFHLDPYVPSTDPLERSIGNPDLRPSYMNSLSLDYTHPTSWGTLRVAPYVRSTSDVWERIRTVDGDGVATAQWQNAARSRAYGSNFTISLRGSGRLSGSTNVSVYRDVRDGTNLAGDYESANLMWSAGGNVGIRLGESLTAQVMGNHFPMQSQLQGRSSGYTFTSLALRRDIMDGRGRISLNLMDPLNLMRQRATTVDPTHVRESRSSVTSRVMTLGFTLNLGQAPQRQSRPVGQPEQPEGATIPVPGG